MKTMSKDVIIVGTGGHAKVITDIVRKSNDNVIGYLDDYKLPNTLFCGAQIFGPINMIYKLYETNNNLSFFIAIGDNQIRRQIAERYNVPYYTAIHPSAVVASDVLISEGSCVMANAVINSNSIIYKHTIINTGAIIEHDNEIDNFVHISTNSSLGGSVRIGKECLIGIGSTVKNNIKIIDNCIIGAGAVVVKDVNESGIYIGIPATKKEG